MNIAPSQDQATHVNREMPVDLATLREVGDTMVTCADWQPKDPDTAPQRWEEPGDGFEDRGFAGTVWSNQSDQLTPAYDQIDILNSRGLFAKVCNGQLMQFKGGGTRQGWGVAT